MADDFDPDAYLAEATPKFDPDAYLAETEGVLSHAHREGMRTLSEGVEAAKSWLNPYSEQNQPLPQGASSWDAIKRVLSTQLAAPGQALNATLGVLGGYPQGAATSLVGRNVVAPAIHKMGQLINPEEAAKHTTEDVYEKTKGDVGLALSALRAGGAPRVDPAGTLARAGTRYDVTRQATNQIPVSPQEFSNIANRIEADWYQQGLRRAKTGDEPYTALANLRNTTGGDITELVAQRSGMRDAAWNATGPAQPAYLNAVEHLTRQIEARAPHLAPALRRSDFEWAQGRQGTRVEDAMERARLRAGQPSGEIGTAVRSEMRALERQGTEGLTEAEQEVLRRIHGGTYTRNMLERLGRLDPTRGGVLMPALQAGAAYATGGQSLWTAAAGWAARHLANRLTLRDANRLAELIQSRTPETMRISGPMQEWSVAAQRLQQDPSPLNLSKAILTSRNFANNLKDFDINISVNELLRAIQGTGPARSDEDE